MSQIRIASARVPSITQNVRACYSPHNKHVRSRLKPINCVASETESIQRYVLDTTIAQKCLLFDATVMDKQPCIYISGVRQPSPAWDEGLRPGDMLVGISDPNLETVWEFDSMTSLRFVKDALRMRIPKKVVLVIDRTQTISDPGMTGVESQQPTSLAATASAASADKTQFLDEVLSSVESSDDEADTRRQPTVAEKLQRQYRALEQEKSASAERIKARKARLSDVGQRNDSKLFLGLAVAFLGPALVILIWASASGYLDRLYGQY